MKRRDALFGAAAGSVALVAGAVIAGQQARGAGTPGEAQAADADRNAKAGARISILDFGADPTGVAASDVALAKAIQSVEIGPGKINVGGPHIHFPPGTYRFEKTIELKRTVILEGDSTGMSGGHASILTFPVNTTGIIVHQFNTLGEGLDPTPSHGGPGSIIRNLQLVGTREGSTRGHGIWLRARATVEQVYVQSFKEHGIMVLAGAEAKNPAYVGNANDFYIGQCSSILNDGCGLYVKGADVNAGVIINTSCSHNGAWGFYDSSFLGNTYVGCHTENNGRYSQVSDAGNHYYVVDESHASSVKPGTIKDVWALVRPGRVNKDYPQWVAGSTYVDGGSYKSDNRNARNCFIGCYTEMGQPPPDVRKPAMVIGGAFVQQRDSGDAFVISTGAEGGKLSRFSMDQRSQGARALQMYFGVIPEQPMTAIAAGDHEHGLAPLAWDDTTGQWMTVHGGTHVPVRYTTNLNTEKFGRVGALTGGQVAFPQGVWLGSSLASARFFGNGPAVPTAGDHAVGDRIFNSVPAVGKPKSWVCVAAGTPGTWVSEGTL
jgi:hypothetical protein